MSAEGMTLTPEIYLCRASGEGSHQFKLCEDETALMAFYAEMFGEESGTTEGNLKHFRDPDNWGDGGTSYSVDLYNAKWEVWIVQRSDLAIAELAHERAGEITP